MADQDIQAPPGFVLDPPAQDQVQAPPGFVLDSPSSGGAGTQKTPTPPTPPPPTFAQEWGITNPWAAAPFDFFQGAGAGAMSTARGVSQLAHKAIPAIPEVPESYTIPPQSVAGKLGKGVEQVGEFFLPAGLVSKGEEAIKGSTMLPGAVKWAAKAVPEAISATGVTGVQTGGDLDSMGLAALLAGGTNMILPYLGKAGAAILGKTTGAGKVAIEKAAEGTPEVVNAMRGDTSEGEILQHLRDAMQSVKDQRAAAYRQQLANLPGNIQINLKPIKNEFVAALRSHGILPRIDPQSGQLVLDFSRSTISDAAAQNQVTSLANDVKDWGTRPQDLTPLGLDTLKRRLDDLYSPSSNARALVQRVKNQVRTVLNQQVPGYQQMTQDYAQASKFLDNVRDLSLESKNDGTAIRKFSTILSQNNNYRRELVEQLSQLAGRDLVPEIAGRALNSWTRRGIGGQALGAELAAGLLSHFLPPGVGPAVGATSLAGAAVTSPRLMGEAARLAPKVALVVPKVAGAIPRTLYVRPPAQYTMPDTQAQGGTIVDRWPEREDQLRALGR